MQDQLLRFAAALSAELASDNAMPPAYRLRAIELVATCALRMHAAEYEPQPLPPSYRLNLGEDAERFDTANEL